MKLALTDQQTGGDLLLISEEAGFDHRFYSRDAAKPYFTIAWNSGPAQAVDIDGTSHWFDSQTILPLMFNQSFTFERPADVVAWQFNREFYCVVDHDAEVSCAGFLFGMGNTAFIRLDPAYQAKLKLMVAIFKQELATQDHLQNEMLVVLLKRLIITITKLARSEYMPEEDHQDQRLSIFRKFNVLVESHFRREHSVAYYANLLHKSPKTLANIFALYSDKTALQLIQGRILLEAKRLLHYTPRSVKEITYELGFEEPAYFCNFFKRHTAVSPMKYRQDKASLPDEGKFL
ncbi:MAG: helix-turn-helix domain-containing protein [Janthinobacterium lividum]